MPTEFKVGHRRSSLLRLAEIALSVCHSSVEAARQFDDAIGSRMLGVPTEKVFEDNAGDSVPTKAQTPLTIAHPDSSSGRLVKTQLPTWTTTFEPNIASTADFVTMMQIRCGSFQLPDGFKCSSVTCCVIWWHARRLEGARLCGTAADA